MIELLAIPAWNTAGTTLEAWIAALSAQAGEQVQLDSDPPQGAWIELPTLRIRGYAMFADSHVEAINFELYAPEPAAALALLEQTAAGLAWEIHPDDEDEEEDDD